jgi:hypothetical protein
VSSTNKVTIKEGSMHSRTGYFIQKPGSDVLTALVVVGGIDPEQQALRGLAAGLSFAGIDLRRMWRATVDYDTPDDSPAQHWDALNGLSSQGHWDRGERRTEPPLAIEWGEWEPMF